MGEASENIPSSSKRHRNRNVNVTARNPQPISRGNRGVHFHHANASQTPANRRHQMVYSVGKSHHQDVKSTLLSPTLAEAQADLRWEQQLHWNFGQLVLQDFGQLCAARPEPPSNGMTDGSVSRPIGFGGMASPQEMRDPRQEAQHSQARQLFQGWNAITKGGVGGAKQRGERVTWPSPGLSPEQGPTRQQTRNNVLWGTLEPKWQDGDEV